MANRSYSLPGDDGKPSGFPQPSVNGGYSSMYYPNTPDMMMPYGSYGGSVPQLGGFGEQCPVPQNSNDQQYGYDTNPYLQYNRHHAMVNYASQAYQQAQQSRLTSPQQIADSIYNMAAHAYQNNYPHPGVHQIPYSTHQGNMANAALSVHTGHSPAGSMHSPAGSTHSMGDRPMLSPHIQPSANAAMYNYNQPNQPSPLGLMGQPPHYYNSSNGHNIPRDIDHRPSVERLAAISSPIEKQQKQRRASSSSSRKQSTPKQSNKANSNASKSQSQKDQATSKSLEPVSETPVITSTHTPEPAITAASMSVDKGAESVVTSTSNVAEVTSAEPKPTDAAATPASSADPSTRAVCDKISKKITNSDTIETNDRPPSTITVANNKHSEKVNETHTSIPNDKVTASLASSSKVDMDKSKSQAIPTSSMSSATCSDTTTKVTVTNNLADKPAVSKTSSTADKSLQEKTSEIKPDCKSNIPISSETRNQKPDVTSTFHKDDLVLEKSEKQVESELSSPKEKPKKKSEGLKNKRSKEKEANKESQECKSTADEGIKNDDSKSLPGNGPYVLSPLGSTSEEPINSLSSSGASKASFGDESRLPPRKRKQQLSEHTSNTPTSDYVAVDSSPPFVPPKKRGRPSKEMVKLREAAKVLEVQQHQQQVIQHQPSPVKERKPSGSSKKDKIAKIDKEPSDKHSKCSLQEKPMTHVVQNILPKPIEPQAQQQQQLQENKVIAAAVGNAVLVSPPKKPKASVAEMQKALMKVVSNSTTDCLVTGRRRRGRPMGSKNKKTLMTEQRARSGSASSKKDVSLNFIAAKPHDHPERSNSSDKSKQVNLQFLQVAGVSSAPQVPLKSPSISPRSITKSDFTLPTQNSSWVCVFCNQITNYRNMGDLYGGYIVQPSTPTPCRVLAHKQQQKSRSSLSDTSLPNTEVWFHERCLVWAPGVYMLSGKLYGVYEAVQMAAHTCCTHCKQNGAVVGCYHKSCKNRYHVYCADVSGCLLMEENFSMLCPDHKDKKLVLI